MTYLDEKTTGANTGFASGGLTCKLGALCFYSSSVLIDSSVLRNPPERKARKRYLLFQNPAITMNPSPKTEVELENWMKLNCYNFDSYSINGNFIYEGFGIEKNGSLYVWYYTEKGNKN